MTNKIFTATALAVAGLLAACGVTPQATTLMDQTRVEYRMAQSSPSVATYAPLEMKKASDAMVKAETAVTDRNSDAEIDNLAYLARQQIALTQEVAKRKVAEAEVANAGQQRTQLMLDQRTNEANAAQIRANAATLGAVVAQRDAADANARNAELEAQLADLAAEKTERGIVITINDVLFGFDQASLTSNGTAAVQKVATLLQDNPERNVLVEGFTDSTGAADYNQALSQRRAGAVQSALQNMGIGPNRVAIRGYGASFPVAANDTEANRQLNRRVEIVLSDETGRIMER
jgi:outer membrane protein OmpA-like peptidoglycan-associated protein